MSSKCTSNEADWTRCNTRSQVEAEEAELVKEGRNETMLDSSEQRERKVRRLAYELVLSGPLTWMFGTTAVRVPTKRKTRRIEREQ